MIFLICRPPCHTFLFLTARKIGDILLTVPISALQTAQTVPKSISKPIGTISVHGLLAAKLTIIVSEPLAPWEVTSHTKKDFEDSMPLKWHPLLQALLPPESLSRLEAQKKKVSSDWIAVSTAFPAVSYDLYLYNWLRVGTRTFYYTSFVKRAKKPLHRDECLALVPVADYFNHADVGCKVSFSPSGYQFSADRQIEKGEEIFSSYGHHSNDFLLVEYGFVIDENRWDEITLDDVILPLFSEEQKSELKAAGFLGNFVLDQETVCYRVELALRLLCMTPNRWQLLVTNGLGDEDEHQEAVNMIFVKALEAYLGKVHEHLKQIEVLHCGLACQRDILSRRWRQIHRLLTAAVNRIENTK